MERATPENPSQVALLLKLLAFTIAAPGTITLWLPLFLRFLEIRHRPIAWGAPTFGAALLIGLGIPGYIWCALDFVFAGKGTPAPIDPPKLLVVRGLYRFTRNPMYVSVLTLLVGENLFFRSVALLDYAVVVAIGFYLFVVFYEEPALRKMRGASYQEYCKMAPRWILRIERR
jgi:protein-S-isoprenylcysteine O-methyltransferase Ste14